MDGEHLAQGGFKKADQQRKAHSDHAFFEGKTQMEVAINRNQPGAVSNWKKMP